MFQHKGFQWLQIALSLLAYTVLLNYTPRQHFVSYFSLYTFLFIGYFYLNQFLSLKTAMLVGILFRTIAWLAIPELSDDYFRFLWDGSIWKEGINPYLFTPNQLVDKNSLEGNYYQLLLQSMNSENYFTVYPPFNQYLFGASAVLFGSTGNWLSVVGLKLWIYLAEIGSIILLPFLLKRFKVNQKNALLYILNPLVVIELCGNAHFEGVMIFLLLVSIYLLKKNKWLFAAAFFALSVSIKLIPLWFLPLLFYRLGLKKLLIFSSLVIGINALLFWPFASQEFLLNFQKSINLYFQSFQFNSFVYSISIDFVPEVLKGIWASLLLVFPLGALAWFSLSKVSMLKNLPAKMSMSQAFYYFFSAVIHPWYLTTVLAFSVFHPVKYILVWSYVIGLSYFTYRTFPYEESAVLIAFEYLLMFLWLFIDWVQLKRKRFATQS